MPIPRYCTSCGTKLMADYDDVPNGFIEIIYHEGKYEYRKPKKNTFGRFRLFADNDMEWMYPVEDAVSPLHVLYMGLSEFLKMTESRSTIFLYTSELEGVSYLHGKKDPIIPMERSTCRSARSFLKERPYIVLQHLQSSILNEKLMFLKSRFMKGLKDAKLPEKKEQ